MIVYDNRSPRGRDEGPQRGRGNLGMTAAPDAAVASGQGAGAYLPGLLADGKCPICGIKMQPRSKSQPSCIKLTDSSWTAMRKRGRGGYRYGRSRMAA